MDHRSHAPVYDHVANKQSMNNNVHGRSDHSFPIMSPSLISLGRRSSAGSPAPRSVHSTMANKSFLPSSSQQSNLATSTTNTKATGRFTDVLASFSGRTRSQSIQSRSRDSTSVRGKNSESSADTSTFGIGESIRQTFPHSLLFCSPPKSKNFVI